MRLIKALIALCFVLMGVVFGALNRQRVHVDLWFDSVDARLGLVLLTVVLLGSFIGGVVVMAGVVWPMRRRLNRSAESPGRNLSGPDPSELAHPGEPRP
jgi:uncharacterized integral membrane protein